MKNILSAFLLLLMASVAVADDYTFRDGYYWKNGKRYNRETVYSDYYYYCGKCYPKYVEYKYTEYPMPAVMPADPDWRVKLLDIAAQRDKFEGEVRKAANEQNSFLESVNALGLTGNFFWQNYGVAPTLANPYRNANYQVGNYGVNGNTVYGYSFSSVADVYGNTDANLLYQQAAALAKNSQDLGGQATNQFSGLVAQEGGNRARVAEILAKGQAASTTLAATNAQSSVTISKQIQGSGPTPHTDGLFLSNPGAVVPPLRNQIVQLCGACHNDASPRAGYRISQHWNLPAKKQMEVVARLVADPNDPKFMPRRSDGSAGERVPMAWILEMMPQEERNKLGK